jgi:hypothetical protein
MHNGSTQFTFQYAILTVSTAKQDGTRLTPIKPDLQRWPYEFVEVLREQGIEATATSRLHRTTHERWTIRRGVDPITKVKHIDRRLRAKALMTRS